MISLLKNILLFLLYWQTAHVEASLRCRLVTRGHPALLLQPIKLEEQSLDPMIVVLHDLLTERQTEILRQLGEPKVSDSLPRLENYSSFLKWICDFSCRRRCTEEDKANSSAVWSAPVKSNPVDLIDTFFNFWSMKNTISIVQRLDSGTWERFFARHSTADGNRDRIDLRSSWYIIGILSGIPHTYSSFHGILPETKEMNNGKSCL